VLRWLRSEAGQGTLEYGAILALVLVLLVAGGTAVAAPGIANGVGRGVQRALCAVASGASCSAHERQACTVRSTETGGSVTAKLAFVRLGGGLGLLRAEQSDGSVDLTLLEHLAGGVEASVGAEGHLRLGRVALGGGGLLTAQAVASLGGGRSWHLAGRQAADALQRRLVRVLAGKGASALPVVGAPLAVAQHALGVGEGEELPAPDAVTEGGGASLSAHGDLSGVLDLDAALGAAVGRRTERATGRRTWYLEVEHSGALALTGGVARLGADAQATLALTFARDGTPSELSVTATGSVAGSLALPAALGRGAGGGQHGARSAEVAASLDLTQPDDLAAVRRLLAALRPGAGVADAPAALGAVGARLAGHGRVEVRRYGADRSELGAGGQVGAGAEAGVDVSVTRATSRLLDAWTRPGGGAWERRVDCLEAT
jgi:Flp pilus assembly pilin Flp